MVNFEDKIRAMFWGIYLGDCAGLPVESRTAEEIKAKYGRIDKILSPSDHKWFQGQEFGCASDDWQLTAAVSEAMIMGREAKDAEWQDTLNMDNQAIKHLDAMDQSTAGWGSSTRNSVRRIKNGEHWSISGETAGAGNGVAMKIAPLGAWFSLWHPNDRETVNFVDFVEKLSKMTHKSSMAASSGLAQACVVSYCLELDPEQDNFDPETFVDFSVSSSKRFEEEPGDDSLTARLQRLVNYKEYDADRIAKEFGNGSCWVKNSLPFTYAYFLNNPNSFEVIWDIVNAGGDTDSNASIAGALLGALNGMSVFPESVLTQVPEKYRMAVDDLASRFTKYHNTARWSSI